MLLKKNPFIFEVIDIENEFDLTMVPVQGVCKHATMPYILRTNIKAGDTLYNIYCVIYRI